MGLSVHPQRRDAHRRRLLRKRARPGGVRLEADDAHGILQLARYAARAPVAPERLRYIGGVVAGMLLVKLLARPARPRWVD